MQPNNTILSIILFILVLFKSNKSQLLSPCPNLFNYETNSSETGQWYGTFFMQTSEEYEGIIIQIFLDLPAKLLGNWFGETSTIDNKEFIIRNLKYNLKSNSSVPIRFYIKYETINNVPSLTAIHLNGKVVCSMQHEKKISTKQVAANYKNPVFSFSNRFSNSEETQSNKDHPSFWHLYKGSDFFLGDLNLRSKIAQFKINPTCGKVETKVIPLVTNGGSTIHGEWPWHAAIYNTRSINFTYICGGTLITLKHILTAAHCVTRPQSERAIDPRLLSVYLGKYSLKKFDFGVQFRDANEIVVHSNYNADLFWNDIAMLTMNEAVQPTMFVGPCCLWRPDQNVDDYNYKLGTVVGWGFDENGKISDNLLQTQLPIVPKEECIASNVDFFSQFTFDGNYCAGHINGSSVCNGDSGGGMVFSERRINSINPIWYLRGIVSISVVLQGQTVCDTSNYIVFTDVAKHLDWISAILSK